MGEKTYATIYVDKDVVRKAKDLGLNISKTCENALKIAIKRLEDSNLEITSGNPHAGSSVQVVDGTGFEPAASAMPTLRSFQADLPALSTNPYAKPFKHYGKKTRSATET
jgi:post-segregation antitoxin (ccd killing protein)